MTKTYILRSHKSETASIDFFRVRQKVSALCYQAKEDLEESVGCCMGDKGMEAGVFGREGLSRALGVRHPRQQQGLRLGGCEGGQPEKIRDYLPTNKLALGGRGYYSYLGISTE